MTFRTALWRWQMKSVAGVWILLPLASWIYVLVQIEPFGWSDAPMALCILISALFITAGLNRFGATDGAFLYSRGYTRDTLWAHTMLAAATWVMIVWLPAALIVWTPLRSLVQDKLFQSAYFPLFAPREAIVPLIWLLGYGVLLPVFQYAWIRRHQPTRGGRGGALLAVGLVLAAALVLNMNYRVAWFQCLAAVVALIIALAALIAGRRLHRRMEVHA